MTAIATRGLCWAASRDFRIDDVSLTAPAGGCYGFLGPNGSGKTTTIRLLLGLLAPDRGAIELLGHPVPDRLPEALARIGVVPERPHLHPHLTVAEALRFHAAFFTGWDPDWADRLRRDFRLGPDQRLSRLSKGEMGKLMMLLALAQRPDLLILDEPTDGLDPLVRRDALAAVMDYVARTGATVFISSHLIHEVERFCDRIGVMDAGQLVAEVSMEEFRSGIKRLEVIRGDAAELHRAPFALLGRTRVTTGVESWSVRGWLPGMADWFITQGAELRLVEDLDLEDGFVELLSTWRDRRTA